MKSWKQNNILRESQVERDLAKMTEDLYNALCDVYDKWEDSAYCISDVIDLCIEEAMNRAKQAKE